MKKIHNFLVASILLLGFASCQQEWTEELFEQTVSFAKNNVTDTYIRYKEGGNVTYKLPLVVSGSLVNNKDMAVNVALDPDTLNHINTERFATRDDLYFLQLEDNFYTVPSQVAIKSGENIGLMDIDFSLEGINMVRNHVLPLTIIEGSNYVPNMRRHFRKALLNIIPFNDYSGNYSATNAAIDDGTGNPMTVATRWTGVVDERSIFFYAGMIQEDLINREDYKVICKFIKQSGEGSDEGLVELSSPNPAIGFNGNGTYIVTKVMDEVTPYLEHVYTTIYLDYSFDEIISPSVKIHYTVSGSMVLQRKRNTLIPDEDQAWEW